MEKPVVTGVAFNRAEAKSPWSESPTSRAWPTAFWRPWPKPA